MKIFNLPDLGEGLPDAEIQNWHVNVGDQLEHDQIMVSVETAKAVVEVPAPFTGTVAKLYGKPGEIIKTGQPLIAIQTSGEASEDAGTVAGKIEKGHEVLDEDPCGITPQTTTLRIKATPAIKQLAKQHQVDLKTIQGSGINGIITRDDVLAKAQQVHITIQQNDEIHEMHGSRRRMALGMTQAMQAIVPVTLNEDANVSHWTADTDKTVTVIKALVKACKTIPILNSHFDPINMQRIQKAQLNLGLALDTKEGLYVPVIRCADQGSEATLRAAIERFKRGVQDRSLTPEDYQGATITLSNFGSLAGRYANPIIVPPQVAILGVGKLREQAVVVNGNIQAQATLPLSVTIDHRVITGGEASRFLSVLMAAL